MTETGLFSAPHDSSQASLSFQEYRKIWGIRAFSCETSEVRSFLALLGNKNRAAASSHVHRGRCSKYSMPGLKRRMVFCALVILESFVKLLPPFMVAVVGGSSTPARESVSYAMPQAML